jgi:hypothetical protein
MVFALNTDGTGFTNLYSFTGGSNGSHPEAGLILSGNTLYGTTSDSSFLGGTVFAVNTNGTGFRNLFTFTGFTDDGAFPGGDPTGGLVLSGNTLYGAAFYGGMQGAQGNGDGTMFAVNTDGTGFTNIYTFTTTIERNNRPSNSDGFNPNGPLVLSGNTLYGTANLGGTNGNGTIFALKLVPTLKSTAVGNQIILSWPSWAPNFILQSTTNLVSSAVWNTVSPWPVVTGGQNNVTNPICGAQMFYRLSQ